MQMWISKNNTAEKSSKNQHRLQDGLCWYNAGLVLVYAGIVLVSAGILLVQAGLCWYIAGPGWYIAGPGWFMLVYCWSRLVYAGILLVQAGILLVQAGLCWYIAGPGWYIHTGCVCALRSLGHGCVQEVKNYINTVRFLTQTARFVS